MLAKLYGLFEYLKFLALAATIGSGLLIVGGLMSSPARVLAPCLVGRESSQNLGIYLPGGNRAPMEPGFFVNCTRPCYLL